MQHTQNYQLSRWEKDDRIMMEDFNADNEKIDAALAAKADAEDVTALGETVAAVAESIGSGGQNARIAWGSYTGNGKYGSGNPTSLSFDFIPVLVFIVSDDNACLGNSRFIRPCVYGTDHDNQALKVTWTDHGLSWHTDTTLNPHIHQCNTAGYQYTYIAIGYTQ